MSITFAGASFDATDAARIAEFWAAVLDRTVSDGATAEQASIDATDPEHGPRLGFYQVPEAKTVKNRFHPDLRASDFAAETARLVGLGATVLAEHGPWTTFADPEGNEFDLVAG